jgi:CheY-like chemotaxis protein
MKDYAKMFPLKAAFLVQLPSAPYVAATFTGTNCPPGLSRSRLARDPSAASAPRTAEPALIYVVDDEEGLPELYTLFLKGTGCMVRPFDDRRVALAALKAESRRPDLLITDYVGYSMPLDEFMQHCLALHPTLRILMASGYNPVHMRFSLQRPDRFIQKPFTAHEFVQEVEAALDK